jgi:uncharacterized protein YdiU (UPF0061 family)
MELLKLERQCLKQNATELRRIAKIMSNLQSNNYRQTEHGFSVCIDREYARDTVQELQERLEREIISSMKTLIVVLNQSL